jgi:homoserine dehydrogenase
MKTLKLAIAGLGHVGAGLIDLIQRQDSARLPGRLEIVGLSARSRNRPRPVSIASYAWQDDPVALARHPEADVFVELIGGSDGPARLAVEAALQSGKSVVTANKALIAEHGPQLAALAQRQGVSLLFEAAVAGAIPVVRVLRDALIGVETRRVTGILNGTCNYLLTEMLAAGRSYADLLAEAQRLGYAEADPTLDVSGMDAAHKIAILSAIAFSADIDFSAVSVAGVDRLDLLDLQLADRLGYRIKLIAEGRMTAQGVTCSVAPRALLRDHPLARIDGTLNTIRLESPAYQEIVLTGRGAGAGPTASAVMGDLADLFDRPARDAFGHAPHQVRQRFVAPSPNEFSAWFMRVRLQDRRGALAALSEALAEANVSVDKLIQDSASDGAAPIAIATHPCSRAEIAAAQANLGVLPEVADTPHVIAIEGGRA